jgi:hypothetical protein
MTSFSIPPVSQPGFALTPSYTGGSVVVRMSGNADMNAQSILATALRQVHAEALRLGVSEVVCDLDELYFMNSSCFKALVTWVTTLLAVDPGRRYRIRVRSNPKLAWQRRSVEALRCLAERVVIVES